MNQSPAPQSDPDRLEVVLEKLEQVRKCGKRWTALCPSHDDRKPSLSIRERADGSISLRCYAGCTVAAILERLGLEEQDLSDITIYDYVDEASVLLYQKVRREPKKFSFRRPIGNGQYKWGLNGVRRVLYNLPGVLGRNGYPVFLVEGEKDADRLIGMGPAATTTDSGGGKGKPWDPSYTEALRGADVIILPDNDSAGQEYALVAAQHLYGIAETVHIINLPGLPPKGDVSDWIDAGGTPEELSEIVQAAEEWKPSGTGATPARPDIGYGEFVILDGAIHHTTYSKEGLVSRRLCNFDARVVEDLMSDNGAERVRRYRIASPQFSSSVEIEASEFNSLEWVATLGGARAIIVSGRDT